MENQIILIDKPADMSSFGVVARVRGRLKAELGHKVKVGHTGTLDPFATGLLILLTGNMTKKSNEFLKLDKVYEATLRLGYISATGDPEGELTEWCSGANDNFDYRNVPKDMRSIAHVRKIPTTREVRAALKHFTGEIQQKVPIYSAVKIGGQRAYKLARAGKNFDTPTREIEVYKIKLIKYKYPELKIRCYVSSGTYIRALAEDIGEYLDTGAYLTALRRTKVGKYTIKNADML